MFTAANASAAAEPVKGVIDRAFARGTVGGLVRLPVRSGGGRIVRRARAGKDRAGIVAPTLLAEPERILREPPEATVGRFSPEIELAVYYCGLDAVRNAVKHAGPHAGIWIWLSIEADQIRLEVWDNGQGFDVTRASAGAGLQTCTPDRARWEGTSMSSPSSATANA